MSANRVGLVAEFIKCASGRLKLFALITLDEETSREGRTYISRTDYDVDLSKKYGYVFHMSGGGGGKDPVDVSGIYYSSGIAEVNELPTSLVDPADRPPWKGRKTLAIRRRNRTRRLRRLPAAFQFEEGGDLLDWLQRNGIESAAVYCETCDDRYPEDNVCDHCWWCDAQGSWSTPGERCECVDGQGCRGS